MSQMDPILNVMLTLKNNWSLTDSGLSTSNIAFTTGWYDNNVSIPQVTVNLGSIGGTLIECGPTPMYQMADMIHIDIWVRPSSDSNKSLGSAKNQEYKLRKEVERILRSGSRISQGTGNEEFVAINNWSRTIDYSVRPVLLRSQYTIFDAYFRENSATL